MDSTVMTLAKVPVVSTGVAMIIVALTLLIVAQPGRGQYPLLEYPNNGARWVFAPPPGWHRVQATAIGLGVWLHPGDTGYAQSVSVHADNTSGSLSDYATQILDRTRRDHSDAKIGSLQRTTVCSGHPAMYLTWAAIVEGRTLVYEEMLTIYGGTAYHATYTRTVDQPSFPSARHSLTTLCGGNPPSPTGQTASAAPGAYLSPTPSPLTNVNSPQPFQTYGTAAPTVTPRLNP